MRPERLIGCSGIRRFLSVPRLKKPKTSLFSRDFNYLRTDEEIWRFAAQEEGEQVFVLYAMEIYTGMRAGELAALEWGDVDLERRLITVHRRFVRRSAGGKNGPMEDPGCTPTQA